MLKIMVVVWKYGDFFQAKLRDAAYNTDANKIRKILSLMANMQWKDAFKVKQKELHQPIYWGNISRSPFFSKLQRIKKFHYCY